MPKSVTLIQVFISCPSDVDKEKDLAVEVCDSLSKNLTRRGIVVRPIHWKEDIVPQVTGHGPQKVIDDQLDEYDYDIYIGILWTRFGDPKADGLTPTEGEFEDAYKKYVKDKRPLIAVFIKRKKYQPQNNYEKDQIASVNRFCDRIKDLGLYKPFTKETYFQRILYETIDYYISKLIESEVSYAAFQEIKYEEVESYIERKLYPTNKYHKDRMFYGFEDDKIDLLELLEKENRIAIIGDAGVGKTVELQRIAHIFSMDKLKYVPFLLKLNKYVDQNVEDLLPAGWNEIPEYKLLIILDGLDEVESKNKSAAIRKIENFSELHPAVKIVISCRSNFFQSSTENSPGTLNDYKAYSLLPVEYAQMEEYLDKNLSFSKDDFLESVQEKKNREPVKNPFLSN